MAVRIIGAGRLGQAMARTALRAATNDFDPSDLNESTSSQVLADLVPGARVVRAANALGVPVLGGPLAGVNLIELR